jgi:alcohol dehydrogenase, propanol-preferring
MILEAPRQPLVLREIPIPKPQAHQVVVRVNSCAICRTDLHVTDGELAEPKLPLIPGHQIVGRVFVVGEEVEGLTLGDRVGIPWLGRTCGHCGYCQSGRENLCDEARFTGYQVDGGYAEYVVADSRFCFPIPEGYADLQAAPLLCAGLIGYRALRMAGDAERLGFYGFGAAAHILFRWHATKGVRFTRTRAPEILVAKPSRANWVPFGPAIPVRRRPRNWRRLSSSPRRESWFLWLYNRLSREERSFAPAFT